MIETITHQGNKYPKFQSEGFAAKFIFPVAREVCVGRGCDIGCNRPEWAFVDRTGKCAIMVDPIIDPQFDAYKLPEGEFDYLFSSHCLEHLRDWVGALDYWETKLKAGGTLFLYLPHFNQSYWRPWFNRKHTHCLDPVIIQNYLIDRGWNNVFVTGADMNSSFAVMAEKPKDVL